MARARIPCAMQPATRTIVALSLLALVSIGTAWAQAPALPGPTTITAASLTTPDVIVNGATGLDVRSLGAIPNDGLDDTAAFNAAITATCAKGGGSILIPNGYWDVQGTWVTPRCPAPTYGPVHITILGQVNLSHTLNLPGEYTITGETGAPPRSEVYPFRRDSAAIIRMVGTFDKLINVQGSPNWIEHVTLSNLNGHGIYVDGTAGVVLRDVNAAVNPGVNAVPLLIMNGFNVWVEGGTFQQCDGCARYSIEILGDTASNANDTGAFTSYLIYIKDSFLQYKGIKLDQVTSGVGSEMMNIEVANTLMENVQSAFMDINATDVTVSHIRLVGNSMSDPHIGGMSFLNTTGTVKDVQISGASGYQGTLVHNAGNPISGLIVNDGRNRIYTDIGQTESLTHVTATGIRTSNLAVTGVYRNSSVFDHGTYIDPQDSGAIFLVNTTTNGAINLPLPANDGTLVPGFTVTVQKMSSDSNRLTLVGTVSGMTNPSVTKQWGGWTVIWTGSEWVFKEQNRWEKTYFDAVQTNSTTVTASTSVFTLSSAQAGSLPSAGGVDIGYRVNSGGTDVEAGVVRSRAALPLYLGTASVLQGVSIFNDGTVSVGGTSAVAKLDVNGGLHLASLATGTCDATTKGTMQYVAGAGGVADTLQMCMKSAADTYSWKTIVTG